MPTVKTVANLDAVALLELLAGCHIQLEPTYCVTHRAGLIPRARGTEMLTRLLSGQARMASSATWQAASHSSRRDEASTSRVNPPRGALGVLPMSVSLLLLTSL